MGETVRPVRAALILAASYVVGSSLWILISDRLLVASSAQGSTAALISSIKGELFVAVTGVILFVVLYRYLSRLRQSEHRFVAAQAELRQKELAVRQGYVDVLDAVTGGKLILTTSDEVTDLLGKVLLEPRPLLDARGISEARSAISETIGDLPLRDRSAVILAASEALTNAIKHGKRGEYSVYSCPEALHILIRDFGQGLDFRMLPKATLIQGFSTTSTMGLGFTIMLEVCDRVLLTTDTTGTIVVLEVDYTAVPAESDGGDVREPDHASRETELVGADRAR